MQIGIGAKKIGLSVDVIRFYERNGLFPRPPRTEGGFRRYAETDLETLAFVRRVRGLGFKLSEIRGLLRLRGNRLQPCAPVQRRLQEKLADVQRKLTDLASWNPNFVWLCAVVRERCANRRSLSNFERQKPSTTRDREVKIEVLYVPECPSRPAAVRMVKDVLAAQGVATEVHEVLVRDEGMATELKLLGSPTIRVNGKDVAEETRKVQNFALSCRLYPGSKQVGLPAAEMIHRAVIEARQGERG